MAKEKIVKGMVLAAGFGNRLKPLTNEFPKPLVPIFGTNPLALALHQLTLAGISDIAVNSHYLADQVEVVVSRWKHTRTKISKEPTILGTGGAYNPLRQWIGDSHLAVINGDIVSSIDIGMVIEQHLKTGARATMVLLPSVIPGESGVFHADGEVIGIGKFGKTAPNCGNFACMQVLSPEFLSHIPTKGTFDIISTAYKAFLDRHDKITAVVHRGLWHDIRSPEFYFSALLDLKAKWNSPEASAIRHAAIAEGVRFDRIPEAASSLEPLVVQGAVIAAGATLDANSFVEKGATVGKNASVKTSLILPGASVPEGSLVERQIIGKNFSISLATF